MSARLMIERLEYGRMANYGGDMGQVTSRGILAAGVHLLQYLKTFLDLVHRRGYWCFVERRYGLRIFVRSAWPIQVC